MTHVQVEIFLDLYDKPVVATLFCLRAKFKNYFSLRSELFKIAEKIGHFDAFIDSFWPNVW